MVGVSVRTVLGFLRHVAHLTGVVDGRGGAIAIIQRFGGAMNLNVHVHALVRLCHGMTVPSWVCGSAIRACKKTHLVLVVF